MKIGLSQILRLFSRLKSEMSEYLKATYIHVTACANKSEAAQKLTFLAQITNQILCTVSNLYGFLAHFMGKLL